MAFNNINSVDISENRDDFINFDIALDEFQQNEGDVSTQAPSVQLHPTRISDISGKESEMQHNLFRQRCFMLLNFYRSMKLLLLHQMIRYGICFWPPVKTPSKLTKTVKNRVMPGENWQEYDIRITGEFANSISALLSNF